MPRGPRLPRLVIASRNPDKAVELTAMLVGVPVRVAGLEVAKVLAAPREDGRTFDSNARKKALHYSRLLKHDLVIADDSGLIVDALDGEPGVRSARLGGRIASDMDRVRLILARLERVPWEARTARFHCSVAIAFRDKVLAEFEGQVEGMISFEPSGSTGFGYDPIFFFPPMHRTFSDLTPDEKNSVSHRYQAMSQATAWLRERFAHLQLPPAAIEPVAHAESERRTTVRATGPPAANRITSRSTTGRGSARAPSRPRTRS